jgi:hypothetical protein
MGGKGEGWGGFFSLHAACLPAAMFELVIGTLNSFMATLFLYLCNNSLTTLLGRLRQIDIWVMASKDGRLLTDQHSQVGDFVFLHDVAQESAVHYCGWTFKQLVTAQKFRLIGNFGEYEPDEELKAIFAKTDMEHDVRYLASQERIFVDMFRRVVPKKPDAKPDDPKNLLKSIRRMITSACERYLALLLLVRSPKSIVEYVQKQLSPAVAYMHREVSNKFHFITHILPPVTPFSRHPERNQEAPGWPGLWGPP